MANELIDFEALQKTLQDFAVDIRDRYKDVLLRNDRITQYGSDRLIDSISTRVEVNGTSYQVKMELNDYWKYVEEGVKGFGNMTSPYKNPGWKAYPHILRWIQIKPILPRPNEKGITPTNNQLAFLITRSIAENGTQGTHDLEQSKEDIFAWYKDKIEEALGHDIENYIRKLVFE